MPSVWCGLTASRTMWDIRRAGRMRERVRDRNVVSGNSISLLWMGYNLADTHTHTSRNNSVCRTLHRNGFPYQQQPSLAGVAAASLSNGLTFFVYRIGWSDGVSGQRVRAGETGSRGSVYRVAIEWLYFEVLESRSTIDPVASWYGEKRSDTHGNSIS